MNTAHVAFKNVNKSFEGTGQVVENLTLTIKPGDFVGLLGPSGSGKSTILRLVAGLDTPTSGAVQVQTSAKQFDRAYVFQDAHLMPWRNVRDNVELPLELMGVASSDRAAKARAILSQVGLGDSLDKFPHQLSGGMKMRASLARALITDPKLLLLDEPFAALDETTRYYLAEELRKLWMARNMTVLFVTHSVSEATFLANRAIILSSRPAQVSADLPIYLPDDRDASLRTDPRYMVEVQKIAQAFVTANPRRDRL